MRLLLACLLALPGAAAAQGDTLSSLFKRVSRYLNAPAVAKSPRRAAVAAVRGGIPTEQGEDLDLLLLDRARALRSSLMRPGASTRDEAALRPIYEALSASQFVQALSVPGAEGANDEAAAALADWAKAPHQPGVPAGVLALLAGPAARIDDAALVKAGWGRHARRLAPKGAASASAAAGWTAGEDAAKLDETLKSLSDSWLGKKLSAEDEARAHLLAGQVYAALARADLKGRAPDAPAAALADDDSAAPPPEAEIPFEPKSVYRRAAPGVVLLACSSTDGTGELGTGSVVDVARRRILTNAHVVVRDSTRRPWPVVRVYFKPAKLTGDPKRDLVDPVEGKVLAFDSGLDLALVEVARLPPGTPAVPLGHPDRVSVGDRVAAIGHPEQGGLWTLTTGVVSTVLADLGGVSGKDAFQTDASINRGNSGGPLLDSAGRMVGINTLMSRKAADGLAITSVNFAVKSSVAKRWLAAQKQTLAYGTASAPPPAASLASVPAPVAAPAPSTPPLIAAAPRSAKRRAPKPLPRQMITESRPFVWDAVIDAEIAKLEEQGDEMHDEIKRKTSK